MTLAGDRKLRVQDGAALLDRDHSPTWDTWISCSQLDLGHPELCVLGQLYGSFSLGLRALGMDSLLRGRMPVECGFMFASADLLYRHGERFWQRDMLTPVWRRLIKARQVERAKSKEEGLGHA